MWINKTEGEIKSRNPETQGPLGTQVEANQKQQNKKKRKKKKNKKEKKEKKKTQHEKLISNTDRIKKECLHPDASE